MISFRDVRICFSDRRAIIGSTYPLSEVPDAIRLLGEGHGRGKVVIGV